MITNVTNSRRWRLVLAVAMLLAAPTLVATPLLAQTETSEASLRDEAETLLTRLDKRVEEIGEWAELHQRYEGEDRRAIGLELGEKRLLALADLHRLVEIVTGLEQQELDASAIRERIEPLMLEVPDRIEDIAREAAQRAAVLRQQRESASPEELLDLEQRIARVDERINRVAQAASDHIEAMEAFGLDASGPRQWLLDSLSQRATFIGRRLELAQRQRTDLTEQLDADPDDAGVKRALRANERRVDSDVRDLRLVLKVLDGMGVDTAEQKRQLAEATGELADALNKDVATDMVGRWLGTARDWISDNGLRLLIKAVIFVLVMMAFTVLARLVRRVADRSLKSSRLKASRLLEDMILSTLQRLVLIFGFLVALSQLGIELAPLLAGLGVAGFIIGFALQGVLSNFASGVMILLYRPFDVDDIVEVAGAFGKVNRMTLVSTTILTFDNQRLVVPNTKIWGDVIKNATAESLRRVDLTFGISYEDDIPKAEALLMEILKAHPKVLDEPEPNVRVHSLGESSVDFIARPWVKTPDYWDVHWDVTREVKLRFDKEGITIPFPQRDVHLHGRGAEETAA